MKNSNKEEEWTKMDNNKVTQIGNVWICDSWRTNSNVPNRDIHHNICKQFSERKEG